MNLTEEEIQVQLSLCNSLMEGADYVRDLDSLVFKGVGIIESATWRPSRFSGQLYIQLVISIKPLILGDRTVGKVFKDISFRLLYLLEGALNLSIQLRGKKGAYHVEEGEEVTPSLKGKPIGLAIDKVDFQGKTRLRTKALYRPSKEDNP